MLKLVLIATLLISCVIPFEVKENEHAKIFEKMEKTSTSKEMFKHFHSINQKHYDLYTEEGIRRYNIFKQNLKTIKQHNSNPDRLYDLGVTEYADWTEDEWAARNPPRPEVDSTPKLNENKINQMPGEYFEPFDWREKGINFPVYKDGGYTNTCRTSYVLAHTYVIEAWNYMKFGNYKALSPQNLIDCTDWDCTSFKSVAWDTDYYFLNKYGLFENDIYPFTNTKGTCKTSVVNFAKKYAPSKWEQPAAGNYDTGSVYNLLKRGPFFFCLTQNIQFLYTKGIFNNYKLSQLCGFTNCYSDGAMVVGYGIEYKLNPPIQYFIVKTTYGDKWGESGYMRILRNDESQNLGINCLYLKPAMDDLDG